MSTALSSSNTDLYDDLSYSYSYDSEGRPVLTRINGAGYQADSYSGGRLISSETHPSALYSSGSLPDSYTDYSYSGDRLITETYYLGGHDGNHCRSVTTYIYDPGFSTLLPVSATVDSGVYSYNDGTYRIDGSPDYIITYGYTAKSGYAPCSNPALAANLFSNGTLTGNWNVSGGGTISLSPAGISDSICRGLDLDATGASAVNIDGDILSLNYAGNLRYLSYDRSAGNPKFSSCDGSFTLPKE